MAEYQINGVVRTVKGKKNRNLRKEGLVPAIVYGPANDPISAQFGYRDIEVLLMNAGGTNLIDIVIDGKTYPALARDVQRDVVRGDIMHVDFFAVDENKKIRVEVPVVMEGNSPVVLTREGILITGPNTITLEVFPTDIRNRIVINLDELVELGQEVLIRDLQFGDKVTVINDPNEMIAKIVQPAAARAEEDLEGEGEEGVEGEEGEETEGEETEE
jgi:large subunit ribosomal protein L25